MNYWLVKSEPSSYSIDDLGKEQNQTTFWNGVRNYQARNYMRDDMKIGDKVIFYHSNSEPPCAVGICEVTKEGYPDFSAFDPESKYFDPKSKPENPAWIMVDIKLTKKFSKPVSISDMRDVTALKDIKLLQKGNRLSVFPLTKKEFDTILKMAE